MSQAPSVGAAFTLKKSRLAYHELTSESIALDTMLYSVLRLNVKRSNSELLSSVMFPSYVQGMIVLCKHMETNRTDRKTRAFGRCDKLEYTGDVQAFQIEATSVICELCVAECSILDYALHKVMHTFDGKNKSIQYKVASDNNTMKTDQDSNIYDMI